jgi:xanthine dehydrogenase accessory factor
MNSQQWYEAIQVSQHKGNAYALATVLGCTGSTPRDQSSKMVITTDACYDTIGGGHLEFVVTNKARELLQGNEESQQIHHFPLGASLGQCCGGSATVLLEIFPACQFQVAVFGAGHVAKELIKILGALPCKVSWIDSRADMFPEQIPSNVTCITSDDPTYEMITLPAGADVLILTHNHQLDFELCSRAIEHGKLRHIGLIGSMTKAERFKKRLQHRTYSEEQVAQIICPVGLTDVPGKLPMEVAVSIAGQVIAIENQDKQTPLKRGLAWKTLKQELGRDVDNETLGYRLKI